MNNNFISYKSYVESTDYYKSLCDAINLANELCDNIEYLIEVLGRDNGDLITAAIEELENLKKGVSFIKYDYVIKKDELLQNANIYDTKFNTLKGTIGNVDDNTSRYLNSNNNVVYDAYRTTIKNVDIEESSGYIRLQKEIVRSVTTLNVDPGLVDDNQFSRTLMLAAANNAITSKNVTTSYLYELYNLNGKVS